MRLRRIVIVFVVAALAALVGVSAMVAADDAGRDATSPRVAAPGGRPQAEVTRGDLRLVEEITGELAYGTPRVTTGRGEGTVTWLPSAGAVVRRGEQLYRVDDAPVSLFYGDLPLYRTLAVPEPPKKGEPVSPPLRGRDVDLVAANLAALGLWHAATSDVPYDEALAAAVEQWRGGTVLEPGDIVVAEGPVRVDQVMAQVGADAATEVLALTSTEKSLTLAAPPQLARGLRRGRHVLVVLSDGTRVHTKVIAIGGRPTSDDSGGAPTIAVRVSPRRRAALRHAPLGPVSAQVVTAARKGVLQVPITSLVALAGGGYAVERPDGALVPVQVGMVAGGRAEVTGVRSGDRVVVAE